MTILSLLARIDHSTRIKFMGILDQQAIAFCELYLDQPQAHVAQLYSVFVAPAHRAQGYAQRLVEAAIQALPAHGKSAVNLRVHRENTAAVNLYKRLGFERYEGPDDEGFLGMGRW